MKCVPRESFTRFGHWIRSAFTTSMDAMGRTVTGLVRSFLIALHALRICNRGYWHREIHG